MINELKIDLHSSEMICSQKISYSLWLILVNVRPLSRHLVIFMFVLRVTNVIPQWNHALL